VRKASGKRVRAAAGEYDQRRAVSCRRTRGGPISQSIIADQLKEKAWCCSGWRKVRDGQVSSLGEAVKTTEPPTCSFLGPQDVSSNVTDDEIENTLERRYHGGRGASRFRRRSIAPRPRACARNYLVRYRCVPHHLIYKGLFLSDHIRQGNLLLLISYPGYIRLFFCIHLSLPNTLSLVRIVLTTHLIFASNGRDQYAARTTVQLGCCAQASGIGAGRARHPAGLWDDYYEGQSELLFRQGLEFWCRAVLAAARRS